MLANDLRPSKLNQIVGQDYVVANLEKAIKNGRVPQTMLFVGPYGTGKTTVARIVAKGLGCSEPYEIDGASNRGIDDARKLKERVMYVPPEGHQTIIIDECHQLTKEAFNALLKTLEEPPEHYNFILVTTNINALPKTILSRCVKYNFIAIPPKVMVPYLKKIAKSKEIDVTDESLRIIAEFSEGSMRDAVNALEQVSLFDGSVDEEDISSLFGVPEEKVVKSAFVIAKNQDFDGMLILVNQLRSEGVNGLKFCYSMINFLERQSMDAKKLKLYNVLINKLLNYTYGTDDKVFLISVILELMDVVKNGY